MRDAGTALELPLEFLNAKLRGRRRAVYERDRLRELASCGGVDELARRIFPRETIGGRLGLERRLRQRCIFELTFFINYPPPRIARFYTALVRRFQIQNVLTLLRLLCGGTEEVSPEQYVADLPGPLSVSAGKLLSSSDLEEFIGRLPADLSDAAAPTIELFRRGDGTGFTEMALERAYWRGVTDACRALPRRWLSDCSAPILWELDAVRLLAVLRSARSYDIEWERLEPLLPQRNGFEAAPGGLNVSQAVLRQLHADPSGKNLAATVPALRKIGAPEDLVELEDLLWKELSRLADRVFYSALEGPAILVAYFYLRRNELKELTALVEELHYGRRRRG